MEYSGEINLIVRKDKEQTDFLQIEIKDNGSGIDAEMINRLGNEIIPNKGDGRGTGLFNIKRFMQEVQGRLLIPHQQPSIGATVSLFIPLVKDNSPEL